MTTEGVTRYANFTDADVPGPLPHRDRYRRFTRNASGRACVREGRSRSAWLASDVVVEVRA